MGRPFALELEKRCFGITIRACTDEPPQAATGLGQRMAGALLSLSAISLAVLLAATIYFMPAGNPAREGIATVLALPLAGVVAVLIAGYRA